MTSASISPSDVTISTVICAYTDARRELLDASIEAVLNQLRHGDQLVVVIDFNDELLARVSADYGARATVVPNSNVRGICGARNSGIEASTGDVVAFVDDDARVQPGWLERLRTDYRDPAVTGVGGNAHAGLARRAARLVPTRIRLGRRLQPPRPAGGSRPRP